MQIYQQVMKKYSDASPEQRGYFNVGLTLGLIILLILLIFPAINHILKLNKEISDSKAVEQKLQEKILALDQAEANYNELKDQLTIVDESLPTGSTVDDLLKQIEKVASTNNTSLTGVQFTDVPLSLPADKTNLQVKQVDYSIAVRGRFANLRNFLTDLENLIRTNDISEISFSEEGSVLSASLKATVYYLGEPSARSTQPRSNSQSPDSDLDAPDTGQ